MISTIARQKETHRVCREINWRRHVCRLLGSGRVTPCSFRLRRRRTRGRRSSRCVFRASSLPFRLAATVDVPITCHRDDRDPVVFPAPTLFSVPSVRISGCLVFGSASIKSKSETSALVTGCPFASLTRTSNRFCPRPSGEGLVVSVSDTAPCLGGDRRGGGDGEEDYSDGNDAGLFIISCLMHGEKRLQPLLVGGR